MKVMNGMTSRKNRESARWSKPRSKSSPDFDAGVLYEPRILFGGQHSHVDPKTGISLYGPYSQANERERSLTNIVVGLVGPPSLIADAEGWLQACQGLLANDGREPFSRPHFPGFNRDSPFQCDLCFGASWTQTIKESMLQAVLTEPDERVRIKKVIDLYLDAIDVLHGRISRPDVILCCIPDEVVAVCTTLSKRGKPKKRTASRFEQKLRRATASGQQWLFSELQPDPPADNPTEGHQNLRRGLKAESMQFGIPTQLMLSRSLQTLERRQTPGIRAVQDIATRAWNFTTALYHKAGAAPWRLEGVDDDVCFVGVSFFRETLEENPKLRTSMAQAFTASGDGFVLRGNSIEWDDSGIERSPHLDEKSAASLIRDVLQLYQKQNNGSLPNRLVVHKSSRFVDAELRGFRSACATVPQHDFVSFGYRGVQFYRTGDYPPVRGTYIKFSDTEFTLYSDGYIPYLRTYPGPRVPRPLEIMEHFGDSPWTSMLREVLCLTKLNWNTADFASSMPVTIAFSRKVGEILAELPADISPLPAYRYYM